MQENNTPRHPVRTPVTLQRKRRVPKWKMFFRNYGFYIVAVTVLAFIVFGIVLICKSCSRSPDASDFDGTYYIDNYTAYEFDGNGKGAMCLGDTTRYVFDYTVKDDTVSFDFEDVRIKDSVYTFTVEDDGFTLTDTNGTASYVLKKK